MTAFDIQYRNLAEDILTNGQEHLTRAVDPKTGKQLKAKKLFHRGFELDLREEFPILTTKRMPKSKTHPENGFLFLTEMMWIWVMGSNKVEDLRNLGNSVWDEWELEDKTIGKSYGYQARQLENHDQVQTLIDGLKKDPYGRRHIVDLWNVEDMKEMALPPCAFMSIWDVTPDGYLNCHLTQRSADFFLGLPFNVSQYATLVHMIAHVTGLKAGILAHDITNVHIYENHYEAIEKQLERKPKECKPEIWINPEVSDFNDFTPQDIKILNYESHPGIKADIAV
jgi:thymidylate synthase